MAILLTYILLADLQVTSNDERSRGKTLHEVVGKSAFAE